MYRAIAEAKCLSWSSWSTAFVMKLNFSTQSSQVRLTMYKPKVQDMKARSSTKVRKVNLSNKLRTEFAKYKGKTPIIACKRMEFNFYEGMKYGKFETVPLASKGWFNRGSNGDFFTLYENYMTPDNLHFGNIRLSGTSGKSVLSPLEDQVSGFTALGVKDHFVKTLRKMGVLQPADIQVAAIPHIFQGKNCVVSAHTGCGKTFAYLLPIVQMVLESTQTDQKPPFNSPKVLILTPSRELSYQIYDVLKKLLEGLPLTAKLVVGGYEKDSLARNSLPEVVDFVVGSLGTLHKKFRAGLLNLQQVKHIVLDEADQLVDDLNRGQVRSLLKTVPIKESPDAEDFDHNSTHDTSGAQITLASATVPLNLESLLQGVIAVDSLERVTTSHLHDVLKSAPQLFLKVGKIHKGKALIDLIEKDVKLKRPVLIFSNTVKTADWVSLQLNDCGFPCKNLTKNVPTEIRQHLFQRFQQGEFDILSTTPMVARGLDTVRVKHVINFDFPLYVSEYIHQIGRVGRIGSSKSCHITNIIAHPREIELVQKIEMSVRLNQKLTAVNANIAGILRNRRERREDAGVEEEEE